MLFRPITQKKSIFDAPSLVSVGEDQCFKIWTLVDDSDIYSMIICYILFLYNFCTFIFKMFIKKLDYVCKIKILRNNSKIFQESTLGGTVSQLGFIEA